MRDMTEVMRLKLLCLLVMVDDMSFLSLTRTTKAKQGDHGWEQEEWFYDRAYCNMYFVIVESIFLSCSMSTSVISPLSIYFWIELT